MRNFATIYSQGRPAVLLKDQGRRPLCQYYLGGGQLVWLSLLWRRGGFCKNFNPLLTKLVFHWQAAQSLIVDLFKY